MGVKAELDKIIRTVKKAVPRIVLGSVVVAGGGMLINSCVEAEMQRPSQIQGEEPIKRDYTKGIEGCPVTGERVFDMKKGEKRILGGGKLDGISERLDEVIWNNIRPKIQSLGNGEYLIYPVVSKRSVGDEPTTVQSGKNTYTAESLGGTPLLTTMKVRISFPCW